MPKDKISTTGNKQTWKIISYFSIFLFFICLTGAVFYFVKYYPHYFENLPGYNKEEANETPVLSCQNCVRRLIDGVYVESGNENHYPVAVVIDNHIDARPPRGLSRANIVYEAEAEGLITRYLAIFAAKDVVKEIGPVRSARPYFLDWGQEFSALFIHCGGSPESLVKIKKENIKDLNEFYNGRFFWRDENIAAPHNIFTSTENLNQYLENKNLEESKYFSWQFKDDAPLEIATNTKISLIYKEPYYTVEWQYNAEGNSYTRYVADEMHKDANGDEIKAKNLIIQFTDTKVIDDELRVRIQTIGSNKAIICLDGQCREGEWSKKSATARTRYYYEDESEVEFNAGTTWIQVVRSEEEVNY